MGCSLWSSLDPQSVVCGGWNWDVKASGWKQSWGIKRENGWCYCKMFLFLAFLTALNWPTFYRKRSACTFFFLFFFYVSWALSRGCAFVWVSTYQNVKPLILCSVFFFFLSLICCLLLTFMKSPFTWPFDVMKSKWLRMFPFAYIKLVNVNGVTLFDHRLKTRSAYH